MDSLNINVANFHEVCRVCMKNADTLLSISLFKIINMIKACTSVLIDENDELPKHICTTCYIQLQNAFNFKELCEESDAMLRQSLQSNHSANYGDNLYTNTATNSCENGKIDLKMYACELCNSKFEKVWYLGYHMRRAHNAEGINCCKCTLICYHPLHLKLHEESHSIHKFECEVCKKSFKIESELSRHRVSHINDRPYKCTKCDDTFKDKRGINSHMKMKHLDKVYTPCPKCGKQIWEYTLKIHMKKHGTRRTFSCNICSKQFLYKFSLDRHIEQIHENLPKRSEHLCNICGKAVRSASDLTLHLQSHTDARPFTCDQCDKNYKTKSALSAHTRRDHLKQRNYICSICSRAFYRRIMLDTHMRSHTGERPFQCHICDKSFKYKMGLHLHIKAHC